MFACLAYMGIQSGSGKVFGWFANMTAIAGLMTWFGISVTYIRFYKGFKAQGFDRSTLPYASNLQPYAAWYAAISCIVICFVSFLSFDARQFADSSSFSSVDGRSSLRVAGIRLPLLPTTFPSLSSPSFTSDAKSKQEYPS